MRWDERQRAMLREIGVRAWWPVDDEDVATAEPALAAAPPEAAPVRSMPDTPVVPSHDNRAPAAARVSAPGVVDGLDWPTLRAAVAACTACRLGGSRRQAVFGAGPERAHWMIVGEVPGEPEDASGEPFAGRAGQLLDNMLRAIGLARGAAEPARQVFITHTLKCRPPADRNPAPDELAQCESFLAQQVQLVQPRIILAMGATAVKSLLGSTEPVGRLRGRVHRYQGVPVIVMHDPGYLLRNTMDKAKAWEDLCLAVETLAAADAARAATPQA